MIDQCKILTILLASVIFFSCNGGGQKPEEKSAVSEHEGHSNMSMTYSRYADSVNKGLIANDTMKSSPARSAMATFRGAHLHINYNSPGVKGRIIWGGLVPYGTVWVTGAHKATRIQISEPVYIANNPVDSGTYAIFTIPGEKEWVFILNKNYRQHLADDYSEAEDVLRIKVKPVDNAIMPRLTYSFAKHNADSGSINMQWEKVKISVPVSIKK
jgi:hypothetical protein